MAKHEEYTFYDQKQLLHSSWKIYGFLNLSISINTRLSVHMVIVYLFS